MCPKYETSSWKHVNFLGFNSNLALLNLSENSFKLYKISVNGLPIQSKSCHQNKRDSVFIGIRLEQVPLVVWMS